MRKTEEDQGAVVVRYMLGVLVGGVTALAACFLLLLLASVAISAGLLGEGMMYQLTIVSCVAGGFIGGAVAVKRCAARPLIVGVLAGGVFFLLLLTIGLVVFENAAPEAHGIGVLCGALCGGAAAGLLGGRRGGGRKRKKTRR